MIKADPWKLVPVEPTPEMIAAWESAKPAVNVRGIPDDEANRLWCAADWSAMLDAAPAPPVPSSVQEIMELIYPYMRACAEASAAEIMRSQHPRVIATFAPLQAALTALVDERDRLKFELAGVNAMRGPEWVSVDDRLPSEDDGIVVVLCDDGSLLTAWATYWHGASNRFNSWSFPHPDDGDSTVTHWMPIPSLSTHGIEPGQGGNHG